MLLYCLTLFFVTHSPFCIHQTVLEYACCFLKLKEETHLLCVWGYIIRSKLNWRGKGSTLGERRPVLWWSCPFMWARSCVVLCCAVLCLVTQLCLTFCDSMDCSPPGSSVHGNSPGKDTGLGCHALLQGIFPTQGKNPGLLHCRRILYHLSHQSQEYYSLSLLQGIFSTQESNWGLLHFRWSLYQLSYQESSEQGLTCFQKG